MTENAQAEAKIEEAKPVRTKEEITAEYNNCAAQAGDANYKIQIFTAAAQKAYERMYQLNNEMQALIGPPAPIAAVETAVN